jgi:hypothetical protein
MLYRAIDKREGDGATASNIKLLNFVHSQRFSQVVFTRKASNGINIQYLSHSSHMTDILQPSDLKNIEGYLTENVRSWWGYSGIYSFQKIDQTPGNYFPRIYRPLLKSRDGLYGEFDVTLSRLISSFDPYDYFTHDESTLISSLLQLETIIQRLKAIFMNVYPRGENLNSFGHEIRNVLILSATEVETQMKGILLANNYDKAAEKLSTKDYYKLNSVLRLKDYAITFPYFREAGIIAPFQNWTQADSTKSLVWYDHYNSVKHDRVGNFENASLANAISSISAICVLLVAQYGNNIPHWKELIGNFFEIHSAPKWDIEDCYMPPWKECAWHPHPFKF